MFLILVEPLKKLFKFDKDKHEEISKEQFIMFFNTVINSILEFIPPYLKLLIKLVNDKVKLHFTIEETNYAPVFTVLFFNFLISPRIQEIYNISPSKNITIKNLNRIIRVSFIIYGVEYLL